jgi:RNA polymerase sigma factor (sigma-70 family)
MKGTMRSSENKPSSHPLAGGQFKTTRWTLVCKARNLDTSSAGEALSQLCRDYWYPLYAFVRRGGHSPEDAQDLTQEFFAQLLSKQTLKHADQELGRFRNFLLTSLKHFLVNEWHKLKTIKRGGRFFFVSWEELGAEARYGEEPFHELSADKLYERRWALTLIDKAMGILRQEYTTAGEQAVFGALQGFLSGVPHSESHKDVAARLGLTEAAVKMRVHRLKQRFGMLLREQIADTVSEATEIDDEMRHLFAIWN